MLKRTIAAAAGLTLVVGIAAWSLAAGQPELNQTGRAPRRPGRADRQVRSKDLQWRLAVMTYTFNRFPLFEAIDKTRKVGGEYIETFSWQKISPEHGDVKFEPTLAKDIREDVKKKLADSNVKLVGYYFQELKDEAASRPVFEFCKDMGIEYIVSEPDPKNLPAIDELAQEYKVKVAIHNHPKNPKKPDYRYWQPEEVIKAVDGCSPWIGCCADNGHWVRSGLDSVKSIRKYRGRLVSMHLKDVNKVGPDAHDVPYGTGVVDMKQLLATVKRMGFSGVFAIEYENNMDNNMDDVAQCIKYFNRVRGELGVK